MHWVPTCLRCIHWIHCRNLSWLNVNKYDAKALRFFRLGNPAPKLKPFPTGLPPLCQEAKEKFSITSDEWKSQSCQEPWASQNELSHAEPSACKKKLRTFSLMLDWKIQQSGFPMHWAVRNRERKVCFPGASWIHKCDPIAQSPPIAVSRLAFQVHF